MILNFPYQISAFDSLWLVVQSCDLYTEQWWYSHMVITLYRGGAVLWSLPCSGGTITWSLHCTEVVQSHDHTLNSGDTVTWSLHCTEVVQSHDHQTAQWWYDHMVQSHNHYTAQGECSLPALCLFSVCTQKCPYIFLVFHCLQSVCVQSVCCYCYSNNGTLV